MCLRTHYCQDVALRLTAQNHVRECFHNPVPIGFLIAADNIYVRLPQTVRPKKMLFLEDLGISITRQFPGQEPHGGV